MGRAVSRVDRVLPLVIAFTKYDLVDDTEEVTDKLYGAVNGLIKAAEASRWVKAWTVGISCGQEPFGVELPLLFTLRFGIASEVGWLKFRVQQHTYERDEYIRKSESFWGKVSDWWKEAVDEPTNTDLAQLAHSSLLADEAILDPLIRSANALDDYLQSWG